jgi:glycerate kinase
VPRVVVAPPLPGPAGAAAVHGPQKGAGPAEVALLDVGLTAWADLVAATTGRDLRDAPGAGAAGGVALAVLRARLRPGIELVLELVGFAETLAGAALVVVGEGSLDERLRGKAVVGVAGVARAAGVPVVAVCGRSTLDDAQVRGAGLDAAYALLDLEPDPEVCMRDAAGLLPRLAARIVADGRLGPPA